jgi:crossover junction endodeoxyribonuclease RusA
MKAKKKHRADCFWSAKAAGMPELPPEGNIPLKVIFHPPLNRAWDLDNLVATMKAGFDGLADAWGVNDSRFRFSSLTIGEKIKPGSVKITVDIPVEKFQSQ